MPAEQLADSPVLVGVAESFWFVGASTPKGAGRSTPNVGCPDLGFEPRVISAPTATRHGVPPRGLEFAGASGLQRLDSELGHRCDSDVPSWTSRLVLAGR